MRRAAGNTPLQAVCSSVHTGCSVHCCTTTHSAATIYLTSNDIPVESFQILDASLADPIYFSSAGPSANDGWFVKPAELAANNNASSLGPLVGISCNVSTVEGQTCLAQFDVNITDAPFVGKLGVPTARMRGQLTRAKPQYLGAITNAQGVQVKQYTQVPRPAGTSRVWYVPKAPCIAGRTPGPPRPVTWTEDDPLGIIIAMFASIVAFMASTAGICACCLHRRKLIVRHRARKQAARLKASGVKPKRAFIPPWMLLAAVAILTLADVFSDMAVTIGTGKLLSLDGAAFDLNPVTAATTACNLVRTAGNGGAPCDREFWAPGCVSAAGESCSLATVFDIDDTIAASANGGTATEVVTAAISGSMQSAPVLLGRDDSGSQCRVEKAWINPQLVSGAQRQEPLAGATELPSWFSLFKNVVPTATNGEAKFIQAAVRAVNTEVSGLCNLKLKAYTSPNAVGVNAWVKAVTAHDSSGDTVLERCGNLPRELRYQGWNYWE